MTSLHFLLRTEKRKRRKDEAKAGEVVSVPRAHSTGDVVVVAHSGLRSAKREPDDDGSNVTKNTLLTWTRTLCRRFRVHAFKGGHPSCVLCMLSQVLQGRVVEQTEVPTACGLKKRFTSIEVRGRRWLLVANYCGINIIIYVYIAPIISTPPSEPVWPSGKTLGW